MIKIIFSLSSRVIFIWLCLKKSSIKEYMEPRATLSTKTFIYGKIKSSLSLPLFKSLKSMQTLIFSFFSTTTLLDTYCLYFTTSKKLTFHCFLIFALILIKISRWIILNFCLTSVSVCPSTSGTLCTMISISKPSISS